MQELKIILVSITFILLWTDWVESFPFKPIKWLRSKADFKPFNCSLCMSVRIGIILSIVFLNPLYCALPLFTKWVERTIY